MKINSCNNTNPSFGLIKLKPEEIDQSERLIKNIGANYLSPEKKKSFSIELFKLFEPYVKQEGIVKAKNTYVAEEIISELKLVFWEFISKISKNSVVDDLIIQIDKYRPDKALIKPEYANKSLNEYIPNISGKTYIDNITQENLPVPQSEVELEEIRMKLSKTLQNVKMTKKTRDRLNKRSVGQTYRKIAEKEHVTRCTIQKSVKKGILQIQSKNDIVSEDKKQRINDLADFLSITYDKALKITLKSIELLTCSIETLNNNVNVAAELLEISRANFIKLALKQPTLLYRKPETLKNNVETLGKLLKIPKSDLIKACLKQPAIFSHKPETLQNNVDDFIKKLNISKNEYIHAALKQPALFFQKPETLYKNVETSAKLFGISKAEFVDLALKRPQLFHQKPKTLNNNIETLAGLLNVPKEDLVNATLKHSGLCTFSPKAINDKVDIFIRLLAISKSDFVKVAIKKPSIFCQKPETINNNIETSAKLLGISKSDFVKLALRQPQLFQQKPETLNNNVESSAKLLGLSKEDFLKRVFVKPTLLYQKPETLYKKTRIISYYKKIKQESETSILPNAVFTSEEDLYKDILTYLIHDKYYSALTRTYIKAKLPEILKKHEGIMTVEIPKSEVVESFIEFVKNYSITTTGKNLFEFTITK